MCTCIVCEDTAAPAADYQFHERNTIVNSVAVVILRIGMLSNHPDAPAWLVQLTIWSIPINGGTWLLLLIDWQKAENTARWPMPRDVALAACVAADSYGQYKDMYNHVQKRCVNFRFPTCARTSSQQCPPPHPSLLFRSDPSA